VPDRLSEVIPDPDMLLSLEPEELAGVILEFFNGFSDIESRGLLSPAAFCAERGLEGYPNDKRHSISRALMEAWVWLEREGFIATRPGDLQTGWCFVTRRGKRVKNTQDLRAFTRANVLPRQVLHPVLAQKVWSAFIRGEYDTAVFQAFKEVEVAVRTAGSFQATEIGVDLMRRAFNKDTGPLTDSSLPEPEREATAHLFAGAIGLYKNPHSHRSVSVSDPGEAAALILLASILMNIVDRAVGA
jgi:uncharacterized protein (TIGR02391 family)